MIELNLTKKISGAIINILVEIFGEFIERIFEAGLLSLILKFYFGLSIKTAIITAMILVTLTLFKNLYYKEDFYLAFAIMMIFYENIFLSWFLFIYISYFRTRERNKTKTGKFETFKLKTLALIGEIFAPLLIIFLGNKYKQSRESLFFLMLLAIIHHLNYFVLRIVDIFINRNKYSLKEAMALIEEGFKQSRLNFLVTVIFFILFKGIVFRYAYSDVSWGFIDKLIGWVSWVI